MTTYHDKTNASFRVHEGDIVQLLVLKAVRKPLPASLCKHADLYKLWSCSKILYLQRPNDSDLRVADGTTYDLQTSSEVGNSRLIEVGEREGHGETLVVCCTLVPEVVLWKRQNERAR